MDPLTALSVAGTIVQFVDFGSKVFKDGWDLCRSDTGTLPRNDDLENTTRHMRGFVAKIRQSVPEKLVGPDTEEESFEQYTFERICGESVKIAEQIIERLEKLKVRGEKSKTVKSLQKALTAAWTKEELTKLAARLCGFKDILQSHTLIMIR
jgi:hypothetical protein